MANLPNTPPSLKTAGVAAQAAPTHRERDDGYSGVLVQLSPRLRVIICKDGNQYIIQLRFAETLHTAVWRSVSHHVTRKSLISACARRHGVLGPIELAELHALPKIANTDLLQIKFTAGTRCQY